MKTNRHSSVFDTGSRRRRSRLPIVPIVILAVLIGLVVLLWSRGGEQSQQRVEKAIPADKLGK